MVFVGLISYSLYLIHWPIIAFYKYWKYEDINIRDQWVILLFSFLIAWLMYRFVERPFRKARGYRNKWGNRFFVFNATVLSVVTLVVSYNAYSSGGWLWRYPESIVGQLNFKKGDYDDYVWKNLLALEKEFSNNGKPKVIIIGDSMAADLANVIVEGGGLEDIDLITIPITGNCKGLFPLTDEQYKTLYQSQEDICRAEHEKVLNNKLLEDADAVILASYWWQAIYVSYIETTVDYLNSRGIPKVFVLGLKNQYPDGIKFLVKHVFTRHNYKIRTPPHRNVAAIDRRIKALHAEFEYFTLLDSFCNESGCQRITKDGYLIIFDGSHLTPHGAKLLGKNLHQTDWYNSILKSSD
jgi:SGNH domain-containing protein